MDEQADKFAKLYPMRFWWDDVPPEQAPQKCRENGLVYPVNLRNIQHLTAEDMLWLEANMSDLYALYPVNCPRTAERIALVITCRNPNDAFAVKMRLG